MDPYVAANHALWDEWTPIHVPLVLLDTLAWAGFSERAVEQARLLAAETGLDGRFVVSDVVELRDNLEGDFDVVFTSFGALNWLPNLPRWAEVVAHYWPRPEPLELFSLKASRS